METIFTALPAIDIDIQQIATNLTRQGHHLENLIPLGRLALQAKPES